MRVESGARILRVIHGQDARATFPQRELVNRHRHIIRRERIPGRALQLGNRFV